VRAPVWWRSLPPRWRTTRRICCSASIRIGGRSATGWPEPWYSDFPRRCRSPGSPARPGRSACRGAPTTLGAHSASCELLPTRERVLGCNDVNTLATRHGITFWLHESGDSVGAVAVYVGSAADSAAFTTDKAGWQPDLPMAPRTATRANDTRPRGAAHPTTSADHHVRTRPAQPARQSDTAQTTPNNHEITAGSFAFMQVRRCGCPTIAPSTVEREQPVGFASSVPALRAIANVAVLI
jgi:hypothetical protein